MAENTSTTREYAEDEYKVRDIDGIVTIDVSYDAQDPEFKDISEEDLLHKLLEMGAFEEYQGFIDTVLGTSVEHGCSIDQTSQRGFLFGDYRSGVSEAFYAKATHLEAPVRFIYTFRLRVYDQMAKRWLVGHAIDELEEDEQSNVPEDVTELTSTLRNIQMGGDSAREAHEACEDGESELITYD